MIAPAPVGLYSISVRGLEVPALLSWAARHRIPFIHLRGGRRGCDLAAQDATTLARWREASACTVPVTGVTADTDLADLLSADPAVRRQAREEVCRLADAARALGAGWLRLLARHPLHTTLAGDGSGPLDGHVLAVPLLIELHAPQWLASRPHAALVCLLQQQPRLRLLADSAQFAQALADPGDDRAAERLKRLVPWIEVLHLSDPGPGLTDPGHAVVADHAIRRIAAGQPIEVAVEWTGVDRTRAAALARYHEHAAWWKWRNAAHMEASS
ncbi:AP endonuclease [Streptomyces sp. NPDC020192]|uniref:AP endonuclease n=1 Tax=Streptomyces sp. NPDC020192 TaxID=3365066 RepID=UPI0037B4EF14